MPHQADSGKFVSGLFRGVFDMTYMNLQAIPQYYPISDVCFESRHVVGVVALILAMGTGRPEITIRRIAIQRLRQC
jgi:hypothetical protein